ncbi:DNA/RNA helicase domain-containing protein [Tenacibaculum sp. HL-MS23]|uniref:DNA/RNA helicase domain-containing protein n=1 Tax=Tenacibaculum sp. HL-MS23 TaxID=3077734 RepID=UPI0028FC2093|nr:DNA/RNA helicase domain-containing protein [Tenacibaculum sp. HL-MS23]WNW00944.1 DNA/RNA helicase domain-containing protein [Tenacibaculum sp. HL-MS23]
MISNFELSVEVSKLYNFNKNSLNEINKNTWVKNQWPLVYFIQNESKKVAYVGESTNFSNRVKNHLANPKKANAFNKISIIGSDKFNKSATLDIESKLIQYISSEGTYELHNGNHGLINHNYYQQDLYKDIFKDIWSKLIENKIVSKSLEEIENSELFKYSPYKSLNEDQYNSVIEIINALSEKRTNKIFIKGSAGTGKTILASYLIKLLGSDVSETNLEDLSDNEIQEINLIRTYKNKYPNAEIGFVVAMSSLRKTLQNVFRKIPELKSSMIISPSDTFKKKYDLLIVDEAHRLRQYKNIGWMGVFKKNNRKLGLDDTGTELDWIIANSTNQIFFYDSAQSVKPSDVPSSHFDKLFNEPNTIEIELKSQMRSNGGNDYISFVDNLLNVNLKDKYLYAPKNYEILVFDSMKDMYEQLSIKEEKHGLCRLVAGYSWPWLSDPKKKPKPDLDAIDISIDGVELQWNKTDKDWVNSENSFKEVGCIHTTQGYDLNYTGVIFGEEISFNKNTNQIEIDKSKYFDKNGKRGLNDIEKLKEYIINIYKTIMFRGIKGVYIYACDKNLRDYFKQYINSFQSKERLRILPFTEVKPFVNSVPILDIYAAAGDFSKLQTQSEFKNMKWVELPINISVKNNYFICQVIGESMNKKIENGSWCLFKKYSGGSREGKIVLVEHYNIQDSDFGAGYTIKSYHSEKLITNESWLHKSITLKPQSYETTYKDIILKEDELSELKIIGEFITVLSL